MSISFPSPPLQNPTCKQSLKRINRWFSRVLSGFPVFNLITCSQHHGFTKVYKDICYSLKISFLFFCLGTNYNKRFASKDSNDLSFLKLAFDYFEDYNPQRSKKDQNEEMIKYCKKIMQTLTDLIKCFYLPKEVYDDGTRLNKAFHQKKLIRNQV